MIAADPGGELEANMAPLYSNPKDRAPARVGQVLRGKWRLDELLAVGGMASVFAATHRNGKRGAVKLLHFELTLNEEQKARFLREGYVANKVEHDGAVSVLDDDVAEDGSVFLVMELLEGQTIDAMLRARKSKSFGLGETMRVADRLLDVLAAAHAKGIVHRDIKPENIFVTNDGRLKVLDFGIARLHESQTGESATRTGDLLGTPSFMPPEQALGNADQVDGRSDLWSVGATIFRLLTGRTVHQAESINRVLLAAMTMPAPPIARVLPAVPAALANIVDRALAFEQKDRWPDARTMQAALRSFAQSQQLRMDGPVQATPEEQRARPTTLPIEAAGLVVDIHAPALTPPPSQAAFGAPAHMPAPPPARYAPPIAPMPASPYAPPPPPAPVPSAYVQAPPASPYAAPPPPPQVPAAPPERAKTAVLPPGMSAPYAPPPAPFAPHEDPDEAKTAYLPTGSAPTPSQLQALVDPARVTGTHPHVPTFSTAAPVSRDPTFGGPMSAKPKTKPAALAAVFGAMALLGGLAGYLLLRGGGSDDAGASPVVAAPGSAGTTASAPEVTASAPAVTAPAAIEPSAKPSSTADAPAPSTSAQAAQTPSPPTSPTSPPVAPGTVPKPAVTPSGKKTGGGTGPKTDPFSSRKW